MEASRAHVRLEAKVTNIELAQMGDAALGTRVKLLSTLRALSLSRTAP